MRTSVAIRSTEGQRAGTRCASRPHAGVHTAARRLHRILHRRQRTTTRGCARACSQLEASQRQQLAALQQHVHEVELHAQHLEASNEALAAESAARSQRIAQLEAFVARCEAPSSSVAHHLLPSVQPEQTKAWRSLTCRVHYQLQSLSHAVAPPIGGDGDGAAAKNARAAIGAVRRSVAAGCASMLRMSLGSQALQQQQADARQALRASGAGFGGASLPPRPPRGLLGASLQMLPGAMRLAAAADAGAAEAGGGSFRLSGVDEVASDGGGDDTGAGASRLLASLDLAAATRGKVPDEAKVRIRSRFLTQPFCPDVLNVRSKDRNLTSSRARGSQVARLVAMVRDEVLGRREYVDQLEAALRDAQARVLSLNALTQATRDGAAAGGAEGSHSGASSPTLSGPTRFVCLEWRGAACGHAFGADPQ